MVAATPNVSPVPTKLGTEQYDAGSSPTTEHEFLGFAAGSAIGLVVGLIAGVSISPVTSTILGALTAGLLIFLGFKGSKDGRVSAGHDLKVLGFGLFCSISLVTGICLRTHGVLSPPLEAQKERLVALNVFSPAEISQILLATNFGLQHAAQADTGDLQAAKPDVQNAGLLRAGSAEFCQLGRRERFRDVNAYLDELHRINPKLASVIEAVPKNYQDDLSKSLSAFICP